MNIIILERKGFQDANLVLWIKNIMEAIELDHCKYILGESYSTVKCMQRLSCMDMPFLLSQFLVICQQLSCRWYWDYVY